MSTRSTRHWWRSISEHVSLLLRDGEPLSLTRILLALPLSLLLPIFDGKTGSKHKTPDRVYLSTAPKPALHFTFTRGMLKVDLDDPSKVALVTSFLRAYPSEDLFLQLKRVLDLLVKHVPNLNIGPIPPQYSNEDDMLSLLDIPLLWDPVTVEGTSSFFDSQLLILQNTKWKHFFPTKHLDSKTATGKPSLPTSNRTATFMKWSWPKFLLTMEPPCPLACKAIAKKMV